MRICIDPGHRNSVYDYGATASSVKESTLNLQIAFLLGDGFKKAGHEVFYTRQSENTVISLDSRIKQSNKIPKLDYYLSIHINSFSLDSANGFEVWHYGDQEVLGKKICDNVCKRTLQSNRGPKASTKYAVLRETYCKSFIIECGFISNPPERANLMTDEFQLDIVNGILESFGVAPIICDQEENDDTIEIMLNGVIKKVEYINQDGFNFVKLRDLGDGLIKIDYDNVAKIPTIEARYKK